MTAEPRFWGNAESWVFMGAMPDPEDVVIALTDAGPTDSIVGHGPTASCILDLFADEDCMPHAAKMYREHGRHACADYLHRIIVVFNAPEHQYLANWLTRNQLLQFADIIHRVFNLLPYAGDEDSARIVWNEAGYNREP